jgi:host factor-I protein
MSNPNIQDAFLQALRESGANVNIFLVSGIRLKGIIESYDMHLVVLLSPQGSQMIYKHVISTILPDKQVGG